MQDEVDLSPSYKVIEVEKPNPALELDPETPRAIASLAGNPGFQALMNRLRIQKALLNSALRGNKHESLIEVNRLQSGIAWINWLDRQVALEVTKSEREQPRPAYDVEQQEFERMAAAITIVGKQDE
jgi:hypothetical protein